tara:strand:- start:120 stop:449 length:330 start_codon:yes stop_codon:yes gene_type:complete
MTDEIREKCQRTKGRRTEIAISKRDVARIINQIPGDNGKNNPKKAIMKTMLDVRRKDRDKQIEMPLNKVLRTFDPRENEKLFRSSMTTTGLIGRTETSKPSWWSCLETP